MNRCFTNVLSVLSLVRLTLFRQNCIVTWIILFIGATQTVHSCRTAALHTILSFLISLFASYDQQNGKVLQSYCFQILLSKKVGVGMALLPLPPGFAAPVSKFIFHVESTYFIS